VTGTTHPGRRAALLAAATVLLAVAAVVLLVLGVEVRETTGGLLVTPIRQVRLVGGFVLTGTAAGVAAIVTALSAVPALRDARRSPRRTVDPAVGRTEPAAPGPGTDVTTDGTPGPDRSPGADDTARAGSSPGSDARR